jgi:hypothetical protein
MQNVDAIDIYRKSSRSSIVCDCLRLFAIFIDDQRYLASVVNELDEAWDRRKEPGNELPHVFGRSVTGSIDSFPIIINRPEEGNLQRFFYNGKYACHVVKVSLSSHRCSTTKCDGIEKYRRLRCMSMFAGVSAGARCLRPPRQHHLVQRSAPGCDF